jgi:hypothetical protein
MFTREEKVIAQLDDVSLLFMLFLVLNGKGLVARVAF